MLILVLPNVNYTTTKTGYYKILKEMIAALFRICTSRACSRRITVPSLDWCDCMASSTQSLQDYFFAVMLHLANWHCCSPTPAPATHWQIFHMAQSIWQVLITIFVFYHQNERMHLNSSVLSTRLSRGQQAVWCLFTEVCLCVSGKRAWKYNPVFGNGHVVPCMYLYVCVVPLKQ